MKALENLKTGIALTLMTGLTMNLIASGDPLNSASISSEESSIASMKLEVPSNIDTRVAIFDQEGAVIYADNIYEENKIGKTYDFSNAKEGVYTLRTETEFKTTEKTFAVEDNSLVLLNNEKRYRPVFSLNEDKLTVSYINLDKNDISIVLEGDSLVHFEEEAGNEQAYGKILNIKRLPRGDYSLTLKAGGYTYNYSFER